MMLVHCNSYSQTVIKKQINLTENDSLVCIPKTTVKKIAKDLVLLDAIKKEDTLLKSNIEILKKEVENRDSVVIVKNKIIDLTNHQYMFCSQELNVYQQQHIADIKTLHKSKFKTTLVEVVLVGLIGKILFFK